MCTTAFRRWASVTSQAFGEAFLAAGSLLKGSTGHTNISTCKKLWSAGILAACSGGVKVCIPSISGRYLHLDDFDVDVDAVA